MEGAVTIKNSKAINGGPVLKTFRAVVFGTVAGAAFCAVLLGIFSFVFVSAENLPQGLLSPLVIAASVLSAFLAGFTAAKLSKRRGLLFGAAAGLLLFALFLLCGLAVSSKANDPAVPGTRLLVMVLAGALGGFAGVSKRTKIKHKF